METKRVGIGDFLKKDQPEKFDFRDLMPEYYDYYKNNHKGEPNYEKLLKDLEKMEKVQDPVEKWFLYRTLGVGSDYEGCGTPFDCDNSNETCHLSAEIYEELWSRDVLFFCRKGNEPVGETMNSILTTLDELPDIKETKKGLKKLHDDDPAHFRRIFEEHQAAVKFIAVAHTIGNFTIWPAGCNGPRGIGPVRDYWDLTLKCIHQWYMDNEEILKKELPFPENRSLCRLFSSQMVNFPNWLYAFGSWDNFVRMNYMQDFVDVKDNKSDAPDDKLFGEPKELWHSHFSGDDVLPEGDQIEDFFTNAAEWIGLRSVRMITELRKNRDNPSDA